MKETNYSFETSLPAYRDKPSEKQSQADKIYKYIKAGTNTLLALSELTGLPQSTVSGRCNDLIDGGRAEYSGTTIYKSRKRKKLRTINDVTDQQMTSFIRAVKKEYLKRKRKYDRKRSILFP